MSEAEDNTRKGFQTHLLTDASGGLQLVRVPRRRVEDFKHLIWQSSPVDSSFFGAPLSFDKFVKREGLDSVDLKGISTISQGSTEYGFVGEIRHASKELGCYSKGLENYSTMTESQRYLDEQEQIRKAVIGNGLSSQFIQQQDESERYANGLRCYSAAAESQRHLDEQERLKEAAMGNSLSSQFFQPQEELWRNTGKDTLSSIAEQASGGASVTATFEELARQAGYPPQSSLIDLAKDFEDRNSFSEHALPEHLAGSYSEILARHDKIKREFQENETPSLPIGPPPFQNMPHPMREGWDRQEKSDQKRDRLLTDLLDENKKVVQKLAEGERVGKIRDQTSRRFVIATLVVSILALLATLLSHELVVEYLRTVIPFFQPESLLE